MNVPVQEKESFEVDGVRLFILLVCPSLSKHHVLYTYTTSKAIRLNVLSSEF
jgi:hypothetical protein